MGSCSPNGSWSAPDGRHLDRNDIVAAIEELVEHLAAAPESSHIRIVGGVAIAIQFDRGMTTADVDAIYGADPAVEEAARQIAQSRGWPATWLNDDVTMWTTHFDGPDDRVRLHTRDKVTVSVAGAQMLLAMKLRAARGRRDAVDIDLLLDACGISSIAGAVALVERYYPEDPIGSGAVPQLRARFGDPDEAAGPTMGTRRAD